MYRDHESISQLCSLATIFASNSLGPTIIDEAIKLASMITAGNDKSILIVLEPQHHGSMDKHTIVKHRRLLEDKIIARLVCVSWSTCVDLHVLIYMWPCVFWFLCPHWVLTCPRTMDYWEFSINFTDDNPHGNDRRRTSQQGTLVMNISKVSYWSFLLCWFLCGLFRT